MKKFTILGLLFLLLLHTGCRDEFGKTLFGPEKTVAPERLTDKKLIFVNTTGVNDITEGKIVSDDPTDVIFSSQQPIGQTKEITVSARLKEGKSHVNENFVLTPLKETSLLENYRKQHGYAVRFLPESAYKIVNDMICIEKNGTQAINHGTIRITNALDLEINQDYLLAIQLQNAPGFLLAEDNRLVYLHIKRKGGSGEMSGAADFNPMPGDNVLDPDGVDKGINRNNLYYETGGELFKNLNACTIEGLIFVDAFKAEEERADGTLAGISSLWGNEKGGEPVNFLLRLGDAGVSTNMLQLVVNDRKYLINYKLKEKQWYHLAMTYDGTEIKFFINYKEKLSVKQTGNISLSGSSFCLGQSFNQWRGFNGKMSEVRIWKTARTAKELKNNALDIIMFNAEKELLLAYWKMNKAMEGSGNKKISDLSQNENHLTVKRQGASGGTVQAEIIIDNNIDINI